MSAQEHEGSVITPSPSVYFLEQDSEIWYQGVETNSGIGSIFSIYSKQRFREIKIVRSSHSADLFVGTIKLVPAVNRLIQVDPTQDLGPLPDYT